MLEGFPRFLRRPACPKWVSSLAECGASGLDEVQALGPILLYDLGLGIAERRVQRDEHGGGCFFLSSALIIATPLWQSDFFRHGRGRAHHPGCRCG